MNRHLTFGLFAILGLAMLLPAQNTSFEPDPKWQAPPEEAAKKNPEADKPEALAAGKKLFSRQCAMCHGQDGEGVPDNDAPSLHLPVIQKESDGTLFWKISTGNTHKGMPSFSRLPETDRWQILTYVRTFKPSKEAPAGGSDTDKGDSSKPEQK